MINNDKAKLPNQVEIAGGAADDRDLRAVWLVSRSLSISLACSAFFLILFAWLSEEVFEGELQRFDLAARMKVHEFFSPQMTKFMQAMTFLGSIAFLSTLFLRITAIWLNRKMYRPATWLAIAVGGSVFLDVALKLSFHRARPVPFVGVVPLTYSFPSGHALSSFCFYGVLAGLLCARIRNSMFRALI